MIFDFLIPKISSHTYATVLKQSLCVAPIACRRALLCIQLYILTLFISIISCSLNYIYSYIL